MCVRNVYNYVLMALPQKKNVWNKWNNHFYEMKGDVGMSVHEKERNKKMPTPRHKVTHNLIPTSLFCFNMLFVCLFVMNALGKANSKTSSHPIACELCYVVVLEDTKM